MKTQALPNRRQLPTTNRLRWWFSGIRFNSTVYYYCEIEDARQSLEIKLQRIRETWL